MNEAETRPEHIDPALAAAGWQTAPYHALVRVFEREWGRVLAH